MQLVYKWCYLLLAVEPCSGEIKWEWIERMNQEQIKPVLQRWDLECVVWDGASSHKGQTLEDLRTVRVLLPAYSPELNPAERVFEEVRRWVEGEVYESIEAKKQIAEGYLKRLKREPEEVKRLCGWGWLRESIEALSSSSSSSHPEPVSSSLMI